MASFTHALAALLLLPVAPAEGALAPAAPVDPALGSVVGSVTITKDSPGGKAKADRAGVVVYLEAPMDPALEERLLDAPPPVHSVRQVNKSFTPQVSAVLRGTEVRFPNDDMIFHNVFSLSKPRRFDLGRYGRGASKSVRFDTPGVVRVFCDIHAHMSAYILVFAHTFFAATDAEGRYRIPGVPPGEYGVSVWSDGSVRETRRVTVPEGETEVSQDFVVR